MSQFYYYLPAESEKAGVGSLIDKYALGYAFDGKPWQREVDVPDHGRGVVLAQGEEGKAGPVLTRDMQWSPMVCRANLPPAFLSYKRLPQPEDLQKPDGIAELHMELGDGHMWWFPMVRECNVETGQPRSQLPFRWDITADGRFEPGPIEERWRYLWEITEPAWQSMVADDMDQAAAELSHEQVLEICLALFRVNYRIGPTELNTLGVFTRDFGPANLIARCIGYDSWKLWCEIKKKLFEMNAATSNGSSRSTTSGSPLSAGAAG